jgi:hypothetical protein
MNYIMIKNANDDLISFGLDDGNYAPVVQIDQTLTVEDEKVALPKINAFLLNLEKKNSAQIAAKAELLTRLGITAEEATLLLS